MRELFIPKCWISPSVQSVLVDLLAIVLIIVGAVFMLLQFKNPLFFVFAFLSIRAFSMGIVKADYFKKEEN